MSIRRTALTGIVAGGAVVATLATGTAFAAPAVGDSTQLVRVTANGNDPSTQWVEQSFDCTVDEPFTEPSQDFVLGPGTPVLGAGSHIMTTGQYGGQTELWRTAQFDGTKASDLQHLSYATFARSNRASDTGMKQPAYLRLSFNTSGDANASPDATLYYEPAIDQPNNVADNVWQNWDTTNGTWSTDGTPNNTTTLQQFASNNPNAVIANHANGSAGGVSLIAGCGGQGQENGDFGVDRFAITTADTSKLFDFDPSVNTVTQNVQVTSTQGGWNAGAYDFDASAPAAIAQSMVFGPGNPPAGIGSHRMRVGDATDTVQFWRTTALDGINVGDVRKLDYSTFVQPDSGNAFASQQQPPYLRLSISSDGSGTKDTTLNFEPANNPDQGAVEQNAWQTWNTATGLYRVVEGPGETADSLITLAAYAARHPKAVIVPRHVDGQGTGGVSLLVGAAGNNQVDSNFYVDKVEADYFHGAQPDTDATFDFERVVPVPSIHVPSVVLGKSRITISGATHVVNAPVALFQKNYGATSFTKVATGTAAANGTYAFHRTVSKRTSFYVRSYDRTNSKTATVQVRIKVTLTTSSPRKGKLRMHIATNPIAPGQTARFYRVFSDGHRQLLAIKVLDRFGRTAVTVNAPSGHTVTVMATVTPPPGNLRGVSPKVRQAIL